MGGVLVNGAVCQVVLVSTRVRICLYADNRRICGRLYEIFLPGGTARYCYAMQSDKKPSWQHGLNRCLLQATNSVFMDLEVIL